MHDKNIKSHLPQAVKKLPSIEVYQTKLMSFQKFSHEHSITNVIVDKWHNIPQHTRSDSINTEKYTDYIVPLNM